MDDRIHPGPCTGNHTREGISRLKMLIASSPTRKPAITPKFEMPIPFHAQPFRPRLRTMGRIGSWLNCQNVCFLRNLMKKFECSNGIFAFGNVKKHPSFLYGIPRWSMGRESARCQNLRRREGEWRLEGRQSSRDQEGTWCSEEMATYR